MPHLMHSVSRRTSHRPSRHRASRPLPRYSAGDLDRALLRMHRAWLEMGVDDRELVAYATQVAWLVAEVAHDLPLDDAIDLAIADRTRFEIERYAGTPATAIAEEILRNW
ncbi:hypothetical protein H4J02_06550 [Protaetiibacter sp. SSC-01]|uniref:hypothetical protein n=1 Tax=Protaetiibacter sp. SSC-01 TaxID=2759943 RepID=UPI001656F080|nr:hypothetical protein [Protaetiibacter sp. SSC-01]QNO38646.1 hypothetical protein H4J02_06550 [Protaetiibacter sp. SSC-01]